MRPALDEKALNVQTFRARPSPTNFECGSTALAMQPNWHHEGPICSMWIAAPHCGPRKTSTIGWGKRSPRNVSRLRYIRGKLRVGDRKESSTPVHRRATSFSRCRTTRAWDTFRKAERQRTALYHGTPNSVWL
eukprot:scaffold158408_cov27-Tisochrysis_lutea.AAC.2